jgi:integrase
MKEGKAVTLVRHVKTASGWRYLDAAIADNGRVLANQVIVRIKITPGLPYQILGDHQRKGKRNGKPEVMATAKIEGKGEITGVLRGKGTRRYIEAVEVHPEGSYKLRSYSGRGTVYTDVESNDPTEAKKALDEAVRQNNLLAAGMEAKVDVSHLLPGSVTLETYLSERIKKAEQRGELEMAKKLRINCGEFLFGIEGSKTWPGLRKGITPEEITLGHLENFCAACKAKGSSKRTVENKYDCVKQFLKFTEVVLTKKMQEFKPPKSEEKLPEYYTKSERDRFLAACKTPRERIVFCIALKTGLRDQELQHIEESEFDFEAMTVTVHSKSADGFLIKDKAERRIPLDAELATEVQAYIKANPGIRWITGNAAGNPDRYLLDLAKKIGRRAGLKCRVFLHKFRATYATTLLRNKIDITTVQKLMGHEDIATTMKYLRAIEAEDEDLQRKVNEIKW